MEENAGGRDEFVPTVSRRAIGDGVSKVYREQRVPGEFRRHGHAGRKHDLQRAIEQLGTSGGWNAAEPEPGVYGGEAGRVANS